MFTIFFEQPRPNTKPTADTIQRQKTNRWVMPRGLRAGVRSVHHASNPGLRASVRQHRTVYASSRGLRTGDGLCAPSEHASSRGLRARVVRSLREQPVEVRRKMTQACPTTGVGAQTCPSGVERSCWKTLIVKIVSGKRKGTATGADKLFKTKNMPTHK